MRNGPREQPLFSEIERSLNEARLDDAQQLLASFPDGPDAEGARTYFATRLLFERGRLDQHGVIERVRDLLRQDPDFPEAERLLRAAERGAIEPAPESAAEDAAPRTITARLERPTEQAAPPSSSSPCSESLHAIPRAPLVPRFGANERSPSYVPRARPSAAPAQAAHDDTRTSLAPLSEPPPTVPSPEPPPPSTLGDHVTTEARLRVLFGDLESALVSGRPELAIQRFERACRTQLRALTEEGDSDSWASLAKAAARLFSELPVLCHFAPYDSSVFSVERLSAALAVLYAGGAPESDAPDAPGILLAAAYLGETVRQAFGGEWHGAPSAPRAAFVQALGLTLHPCERVAEAIQNRAPLAVEQPARLHPAADPFGNSTPLSLAPPTPWDPEPWPSLQRLTALGRLLPSSVVGVYCEQHGTRLDHSAASLDAIDRYVELLAPLAAPPAHEVPWVRRAAVIVGAYTGEVLVRACGAHFHEPDRSAGADGYTLALANGATTQPIAYALGRLSGRHARSLAEYAHALL